MRVHFIVFFSFLFVFGDVNAAGHMGLGLCDCHDSSKKGIGMPEGGVGVDPGPKHKYWAYWALDCSAEDFTYYVGKGDDAPYMARVAAAIFDRAKGNNGEGYEKQLEITSAMPIEEVKKVILGWAASKFTESVRQTLSTAMNVSGRNLDESVAGQLQVQLVVSPVGVSVEEPSLPTLVASLALGGVAAAAESSTRPSQPAKRWTFDDFNQSETCKNLAKGWQTEDVRDKKDQLEQPRVRLNIPNETRLERQMRCGKYADAYVEQVEAAMNYVINNSERFCHTELTPLNPVPSLIMSLVPVGGVAAAVTRIIVSGGAVGVASEVGVRAIGDNGHGVGGIITPRSDNIHIAMNDPRPTIAPHQVFPPQPDTARYPNPLLTQLNTPFNRLALGTFIGSGGWSIYKRIWRAKAEDKNKAQIEETLASMSKESLENMSGGVQNKDTGRLERARHNVVLGASKVKDLVIANPAETACVLSGTCLAINFVSALLGHNGKE